MTIRTIVLIAILALGLLAAPLTADAQQAKNVPRIGYLSATSPSALAGWSEAFRQGLRELGYVEGKNIVVEYRYAEGKFDRLPDLAAELVRLKVDIIVSVGPAVTSRIKEATGTIPIVMCFAFDPVGSGFVASLARPGGNITGLSTLSPELGGKQLELLKEILPQFSRLAVLGDSTEPGNARSLQELERAAKAFGVTLQPIDVVSPTDIETAFRAASKGSGDAVLVLPSPVTLLQRTQVLELAVQHRLPAIYSLPLFVQAGGLMFYGPSFPDLFRRAATYVDKILKGAKPADLPVEQPTKFDLIINLKTAKQLGITIPPIVLYQATKVIR